MIDIGEGLRIAVMPGMFLHISDAVYAIFGADVDPETGGKCLIGHEAAVEVIRPDSSVTFVAEILDVEPLGPGQAKMTARLDLARSHSLRLLNNPNLN